MRRRRGAGRGRARHHLGVRGPGAGRHPGHGPRGDAVGRGRQRAPAARRPRLHRRLGRRSPGSAAPWSCSWPSSGWARCATPWSPPAGRRRHRSPWCRTAACRRQRTVVTTLADAATAAAGRAGARGRGRRRGRGRSGSRRDGAAGRRARLARPGLPGRGCASCSPSPARSGPACAPPTRTSTTPPRPSGARSPSSSRAGRTTSSCSRCCSPPPRTARPTWRRRCRPAGGRTRGARLRYGRPLGPHPVLVDVLDRRLREAGARPGDPVVLVAGGALDPDANAQVAATARLLWEGRGLGRGRPRLRRARPGPPCPRPWSGCAGSATSGSPSPATSSVPGGCRAWSRSQARAVEGLEVVVSAPLGPTHSVAGLLLDRFDEVLGGDIRMNCDVCLYRAPLPGREAAVGAVQQPHSHPEDPA